MFPLRALIPVLNFAKFDYHECSVQNTYLSKSRRICPQSLVAHRMFRGCSTIGCLPVVKWRVDSNRWVGFWLKGKNKLEVLNSGSIITKDTKYKRSHCIIPVTLFRTCVGAMRSYILLIVCSCH